ncbi:MAG: O-methyltransferase [Ferruginibacter sp.]
MSELINDKTEEYIQRFTSGHDDLLRQVLEDTYATHPHAEMISGEVQGKLLQMVSCMIKPVKVLEIGTFTGFSALCLAEGIPAGGMLHTIELRPEDAATAGDNFNKSRFANIITLHTGNAKEIIPTLQESWDLVFIDADKMSYIDYYELTLPRLKTGGFILADNVLFHGEVTRENITGKNAIAIHAFNGHVLADQRTEQVLLSVRDGITLIRKL